MGSIVVKNLGKRYKRYPNRWARFSEWLTAGRRCAHEERWVLRCVSFRVKTGESVGIVGVNGAGKSTLLKILAGTTQPSEGSLHFDGRIAALLELGMGFHPDFTGRENAIMACRMTGLGSEEIQARMPEIEAFSELGDYMDQPLRVYSTGMLLRLAFSAATVIRPDILIVDEALSVGDAYFSHKCMKRIRSFRDQGTTLLFVSHDPGAVKTLCERALLLDQGVLIREGAPDQVLDYYNAMIARKHKDEEIRQIESELGKTVTRSGTGQAHILKVEMFNGKEQQARAFRVGEVARIHCHVAFSAPIENPTVGIVIRDRLGNEVFGTNTYHLKIDTQRYEAGAEATTIFSLPLNLGYGNYSLSVAVHSGDTHLVDNYDWWDQCLVFQVIPGNSPIFIGLAALPVEAEMLSRPKDDRNQQS
jgi:lipopolysaccharide transport system ATP-binding protein